MENTSEEIQKMHEYYTTTEPPKPVGLYKNIHHQENHSDNLIIPNVKGAVPYKKIPSKPTPKTSTYTSGNYNRRQQLNN